MIQPYDEDDDLLELTRSDHLPRLRLSTPAAPLLVLGRGSVAEREVWTERALQDGVPLARRRGGGCAVVLDPGNALISVSLPAPGFGENLAHFARISRWLIAGLARLGVPGVTQRGVSDLALGERKVGGACIYRTRGLLYYAATLLVAPQLALMERYLQHPPREPDYRRGRPHRDFVAPLPLPGPLDSAPALADALRQVLSLGDLSRRTT